MSWGGRRPGTGRKPKPDAVRAVDGTRDRRPGRKAAPVLAFTGPGAPVPVEEFDAPDDLTFEERAIWMKLAPHAFANRTLTLATAFQFEMLCRNSALERKLGASGSTGGGSDHRGLIQRVDAELLRFNLSPCGKPMYDAVPEKPVSALDKIRNRKRG